MFEFRTMDHESGSTGGDSSDPSERPAARLPSVRELEEILNGHAAEIQPRSEKYQAALLLLAGAVHGHNVDLLSRRTGIARPLVARVARRLIDNGVWQAGKTVADWAVATPLDEAFWNDLAVAEGRMCRRVNEDGSTEWAPAGFWNKNFQFVDPESDARLSSTYLDANPTVPAPETPESDEPRIETIAASNADAAERDSEPTGKPTLWLEPSDDETVGAAAGVDGGTVVAGPVPSDKPVEALPPGRRLLTTVPSLDELFGNVTWIG